MGDFIVPKGRRRKRIDLQRVQRLIDQQYTLGEIAEIFNVDYVTLWRRIREVRLQQNATAGFNK